MIHTRSEIEEWCSTHLRGRFSERSFNGFCPLHDDHSKPSFAVYRSTGQWICFSQCGKGTFDELVRRWDELHYWQVIEPQPIPTEPVKSSVLDVSQFKAGILPKWMIDRGFDFDIAERWEILTNPDDASIIFPFYDIGHANIGYIQRQFIRLPKYRFPAQFPRSEVLFGEWQSKDAEQLWIVEGQLDAIWGSEAGMPTVAIGGVYINKGQVDKLARFKRLRRVVLALDNDEAGNLAANNAVLALSKLGVYVEMFAFPTGCKDFQELPLDELKEMKNDTISIASIFTR